MNAGIRMNCMARNYSKIAMLNYLKAKELIEECHVYLDLREKKYIIKDSIIVSIVFSAMTIESFINDYAAIKLGDKFFNENIDRLQPISKLQVLSKISFDKELNKGEKLFSLLSKLFKNRNKLVHNKSKDGFSEIMSKNFTLDNSEEWVPDIENIFKQDKKKILTDLKEAQDGISSIYELVKYFVLNDDDDYYFKFMLLHSGYSESLNDEEAKMITNLNEKFGFPEVIAHSLL